MTQENKKVEPTAKATVAPAAMSPAPAVEPKAEAPKPVAAPVVEPTKTEPATIDPNIIVIKSADNAVSYIAIPTVF